MIERLNRVIAALYDAAADPKAWSDAVHLAAALLDAQTWSAQIHDSRRDSAEMIETNWPQEVLDLYVQHYWKLDLWTAGSRRLPPLRANLGEELADPAAVLRSEIYNDLCVPYLDGLMHIIGGLTPLDNGAMGMLGLHRPRDAEPFSRHDQRVFALLLPHYHRALRIRQTLRAAKTSQAIGFAALDALAAGAMVLSPEGVVLFANRAAEAMAAERDGLDLGGCGRPIGAARHSETVALHALIAAAADPGRTSRGGAMRLSRPSGRRAYAVLVAPLPVSLSEREEGGSPALLIITDPERQQLPATSALTALYGLTPREAQLAAMLIAGCSVDRAAEQMGVTRDTARTYLKRIFAKTDTARQSELVALLLRAAGPL